MRHHGIVGVHKPAKVRTMIPAEEHPPPADRRPRHDPIGRPHRGVLGQRGRRIVLVITQTRSRRPLPLRHASRCTPSDLRLDQPIQPIPPALEPRAICRPSSGNSYPVDPEPTRPRNKRDQSTGGASVFDADFIAKNGKRSRATTSSRITSARAHPAHGRAEGLPRLDALARRQDQRGLDGGLDLRHAVRRRAQGRGSELHPSEPHRRLEPSDEL